MAGLYIHIPFCASRCIYCGFYSTTFLSFQDRYTEALCREMELRKDYFEKNGEPLNTIYLGGGTPSQLSAENLQKLFHNINKVCGKCNGEITIECNPDDVTDSFCQALAQLPINRVSMGAQTFSNNRLRFLHRRHTAEQVPAAIKLLRGIGIHNISIDLMFGFPNETMTDWQHDIDEALALQVEHISAYSLMYEEGTPLFKMIRENPQANGKASSPWKEIDEETSLAMYENLVTRLEAAGYEHYEISNFAKRQSHDSSVSPYRSCHNSSYWNGTPYIGIGAAAHSYNRHSRQWNVADLHAYMGSIERGQIPEEHEEIDDRTAYNDLVTTALRTRDGIHLNHLQPFYQEYLLRQAQPFVNKGLLSIENGHIHLTRKGIFISDTIMSEMICL